MSTSPIPLPATAPLEALEDSLYPGYVLDERLRISYCNQAWDRHAREEGGDPEALAKNIVSRNLLDFVAPELKGFYAALFARARVLGKPVCHDYECSSASVFRLYRMQIYPLRSGFVVQNSLRIERPHDRVALDPNDAIYADSAGIIHACANCRRTRRAADPGIWDWVPAYVQNQRKNTSHGACPMCLEFYYRPMIVDRAA